MKLITVNEAISEIEKLDGEYVYLEGVLTFNFENISISHWPKSEVKKPSENANYVYGSSIWIEVGNGAFTFNEKTLSEWSGKRVVVGGILHQPDPYFGGCGHLSSWPASITTTQIHLLKRWQKI